MIAWSAILAAADITVTDADMQAAGSSVSWTSDNVYILDGFVFVGDGQTLTIEAGTVIKGKPGQEENASALIVARGGKIMANGTAADPIIFTAQADDLEGSVAPQARGLWGGVIVLGKGATNNSTAEKAIEGIPTSEPRGLYGADPTVVDDNSGMMKYVSIRHGGTNIGEGNEINGLTLGAVGTATTFSYIEVVANVDDGVEWFGGAPKCDHIVVAWCGDDSFDYDEGYSGLNQFLVAIQSPDEGDRLGEHDGGPSANELGTPYAHPVFSNVTYVGRGAAAGKRTLTFRDNAAGEYYNSIFAEQARGIDLEYREEGGVATGKCSYSQWADAGILKLENNIFQNVADGTAAGIFKVVSEKDDSDNDLFTVPAGANTDFAAYFTTAGNEVADVGVDAVNPTASGDVYGADFAEMDAWFSVVGYRGAFKPNENWAAGWTLSLGDVVAKTNTNTGEVITVADTDMQAAGTSVSWTSENIYLLEGFVFVGDGQTLTIEAGTVIKGKPGQEENASALIVARGGKIMANGTAADPIIFTAQADDLEGSVAPQARGLWGGVIVLGKGATNNSTAEKAIEGIPTSEPRGLYGADPTVVDDNSGMMKYVSIRHGGTNIGEGNEINGLTLGAVGTATTFSYIEVVANVDDGVEWFGGAPKCDHIVVAWCGDDSFDYDEGYSGLNQFLVAIQSPDEGDRLGEHDGGPSANELGTPYAHPVFSNVTYVGRGAAAGKRTLTFRDNAAGEYYNSIFAEQARGIDLEYREEGGVATGKCSYSQWADAGILKLENNIFQNVADGTAAGIFKVVSEKDDSDNDLFTVPAGANTDFAAYFTTAGNEVADVGVDAVNPTASGDVYGADFAEMDAWFSVVGYRGAFKPNENWAAGWTLSLGDVDAKSNAFIGIDEEPFAGMNLKVYPNPVADFATVEFENPGAEPHTFTLYDMSGRMMKRMDEIHDGSFRVERGDLKNGVYIYRLSRADGIVAEGKLILE